MIGKDYVVVDVLVGPIEKDDRKLAVAVGYMSSNFCWPW